MDWNISKFYDLSLDDLYEICKVRYEVFACGQKIFQENDFDDVDKSVYHLYLKDGNKIIAYARLIPKGVKSNYASIGRVLVLEEYRRKGIASELMKRAVNFLKQELGEERIVISAQLYARKLYEAVGFKAISEVYNEVDIPHIRMELK